MNEKDKFEEAAKKVIMADQDNVEEVTEETVDLGNSLDAVESIDPKDNMQPDSKVETGELSSYTDAAKEERGYRSLGKAQGQYRKDTSEVPNPLGYVDLVMDNLPSRAKFYPRNTRISIRAARVEEIRDFSTIEETNLFDVDDKLNNILLSCINVDLGGRKGYYKDLLEEDRIYVILSIRELTFAQGEHKLSLSAVCGQCDTDNTYELKTTSLQYYEDTEDIERYYDEEERLYVIRTKSAGIIKMAPPKIGVMKQITAYIKKKDEKKEKWDKAFLQILPYLVNEWRGFDDKVIFSENVDFHGWSIDKYNILYRLAEMMKIGVKSELSQNCEKCGAEVAVPVTFPGGIKSLFVIQDIAGELL